MIKAVGYRLLIELDEAEEIDPVFKSAKAAGLVMADTEDRMRRNAGVDRGTVLQIGSDAYKEMKSPWCKVGDYVAVAKYAGKLIEDHETKKRYYVVNDDDVIAVIKEA